MRTLSFSADPAEEAALGAALADLGESASREALARYGAALLAANRIVNVSGAKTVEALVPHLIEAADLIPFVSGPFIDIGSGGGLPALPLALLTGAPVTLIEAVGKKAAVLRELLNLTQLDGTVRAQRAEDAARDPLLREHFSLATARAVSGPTTVAEYLLPLVAVGGCAVMPRSPLTPSEQDALTDACVMLGAVVESCNDAPHGRGVIVVLRKVRATPGRFPRKNGVPAKRPLCSPDVSRETSEL